MIQDIISLLGIANPQLSTTWQDGGNPTEESGQTMRLTSNLANGEWITPVGGLFNRAFAKRLYMPNGSPPNVSTWVLSLHPQVWLRLCRLYGAIIEGRATGTDRPQRPVPKYFAYHDTTDIGAKVGVLAVGSRIGLTGGRMSVHDQSGQPIDPMSVAAVFAVLMTQFPALIEKPFASTTSPVVNATQLGQMVATLSGTEVRVRLVTIFKKPFQDGASKLNNLTVVDSNTGQYRLTNVLQPINVEAPAAASEEKIAIGAATFGLLGNAFAPQPLGPLSQLAVLKRDFLNLYTDDLRLHLLGNEAIDPPYDSLDFKVKTFHNETIELHVNGNQILAQAGQIIADAPGLALVVSPVISSEFSVAPTPAQSEWPVFPAGGDGPIAGRLEKLEISAYFIDTPKDKRDVFVKITVPEKSPGVDQLSPGTAIRIYNRKFLADAREGRGNGAGGILNSDRTVAFVVVNPFGLRSEDAIPANPKLSFDLIAVNRTGAKRSFGLLGTKVNAPQLLAVADAALASNGTNSFDLAQERGIAPSGVLGLPSRPLNLIGSFADLASSVDVALSLGDETQPRQAPRLPMMTRNETIVAGHIGAGQWSAILSGLWLRKDSRSSFHRIGSPGSPGGEEFLGAGIHTDGGLLAYELARMALRRTKGLASRLEELGNNNAWLPPAPPVSPTGTFSVALLQNIAPGADSPNLKHIPDAILNALPSNWTNLVSQISNVVPSITSTNTALRTAISNLSANPQGNLLYNEFRREAFIAKHGKRDALPAIMAAIKAARELIYLETSAFSFTDYLPNNPANADNSNDPPKPNSDLVSLIGAQMQAFPNLKVVIAVSKEPLVGKGYESFAARAYDRREKALNHLKNVDSERVLLFHPIGFPGRPIRLMHNLLMVDDIWCFLGSGSFNRRGFMFDGNLSTALFDTRIEFGRSLALKNLRKRLLENHLNSLSLPGSTASSFSHPTSTRLSDLDECFHAIKEMLKDGGAGFIQPVFDGVVTGQAPVSPASFPHRDLADPNGIEFPNTSASLLQAFVGLADADA
ncbi:MAG: hypothetical protein IT258_15950 [Saprospiraceae bacterium]|nr:hypothetical protein [Saprospiraceae bacterium]